jgi:arabinofuranan 3-O-arabinosyltransferase
VDLRDAGIIDASPALLDGDAVNDAWGPLIQTDGIARRESTPGRIDDNVSARLGVDESGVLGRRALDYAVFPDDRATAISEWTGEGRISASSAASDVDSVGGTRRVAAPASGLDGDLFSSWWSAVGTERAPWWEVTWPTPRALPPIKVVVDQSVPGNRATRIIVSTENSSLEQEIPKDGVIDIPAESRPTSFLRIEASGPASGRLGIREILGLVPERRTLVAPEPSRSPVVTALTASVDGRPWCVHPPSAVICTDLIGRPGEDDAAIDRVVAIPAASRAALLLEGVPRPGTALDALIVAADDSMGAQMHASASSSIVADPEGGPRAAIDRDLETAWIAGRDDDDPRLVLDWGERRVVSGLRLRQRLGLPASRPLSVSVQLPDGRNLAGRFDRRGIVLFDEPVETAGITVRFPTVQEVFSVDPATGGGQILPVGVADLRVLGAADLQPDPAAAMTVPIGCGEGPAVSIGDSLLPTQGATTLRDLVQMLPATFEPCGPGAATGWETQTVRVLATGGDRWSVRRVVFGDITRIDTESEGSTEIMEWGTSLRRVGVPERTGATLLVVRENSNPGWSAWLDGQELARARPDGWQQGWILPVGPRGIVELRMDANRWYQASLVGGLLAAVGLVCAAVLSQWGRRRSRIAVPVGPIDPKPIALWVTVGAGLTFGAGLWGAAACALAWAANTWVLDRWPGVRVGLVFALVFSSGIVLAVGPWPVGYLGDGLAAALPVTLAIALAASPGGGRTTPTSSGAAQGCDS